MTNVNKNLSQLKNEVLKALSVIIDPDLNQDIVSLNFIKNLNSSFTRLTK